jgi:hypothetical protein
LRVFRWKAVDLCVSNKRVAARERRATPCKLAFINERDPLGARGSALLLPASMSVSPDPRRQSKLYWKEMEQLKAAAVCIRLCRNRLARQIRAVELVKVIASSGGIAGWVLWHEYPLVWSVIIAAAQLLDAVKHVFPFAREHRSASDLTVALELLFIDAQYEWGKIYAGTMTDEDIMGARRKMQKLRLEAEQKHFRDGFQPRKRLVDLADEEARTYIGLTYEVSGHDQE